MATPVLVFATFRPLEGKEQELLTILAPMLKHTRLEPGNEVYDLYRSDHRALGAPGLVRAAQR